MTSKSFASALAPLGAQVRLLLLRFLLSFVVYSICRLIFCLYNQDLLEVGTAGQVALMFWGGLRFDLTAILYTSLLLTLLSRLPLPLAYSRGYQRMLTGIYRVITAVAIVLNLGDVVYYRFTLKRTTMAVFEEFGEENPFNFLRFFIDYWGVTLLGIAFIVAPARLHIAFRYFARIKAIIVVRIRLSLDEAPSPTATPYGEAVDALPHIPRPAGG